MVRLIFRRIVLCILIMDILFCAIHGVVLGNPVIPPVNSIPNDSLRAALPATDSIPKKNKADSSNVISPLVNARIFGAGRIELGAFSFAVHLSAPAYFGQHEHATAFGIGGDITRQQSFFYREI